MSTEPSTQADPPPLPDDPYLAEAVELFGAEGLGCIDAAAGRCWYLAYAGVPMLLGNYPPTRPELRAIIGANVESLPVTWRGQSVRLIVAAEGALPPIMPPNPGASAIHAAHYLARIDPHGTRLGPGPRRALLRQLAITGSAAVLWLAESEFEP